MTNKQLIRMINEYMSLIYEVDTSDEFHELKPANVDWEEWELRKDDIISDLLADFDKIADKKIRELSK